MLQKVLFVALFGVCYGSIFEHSLKFNPLRKGIHRFAVDASKEAKKFESSEVDGIGTSSKQGDLLEKLGTALLLKGQPGNGISIGKPLLSLFGLRPASQDMGKTSGVTLQSYSIANCSTKSADKATFVIQKLSIGPDPLVLPGKLTFAFDINILLKEFQNLMVDLDFYEKVGSGYIKVPCIGEFGSCSYTVCDMLEEVTTCPSELVRNKIPCKCPFAKGMYKEPGLTADIESAVFPPGDYKAKANMTTIVKGEKKFAGCYDVTFSFA